MTSNPNSPTAHARPALADLRVIDAATLFAGPLAATLLGDFGADVIKVEHPRGDAVRTHGYRKDGVPLWWKMVGRGKRAVTLNLAVAEGQALMRELVQTADVLIESFRPGTLERWELGPNVLQALNSRLVVARVTGFGQIGPYRHRPGFGTLAEAMSGFAAITGEADGPPTLPPFGLADGVAALATASAIMFALHARDRTGRGQVVDLSLIEPLFTILGPQPIWFDQLGVKQQRMGNQSVNNSPRNTYRTCDGKWVAVSTSSQNIAERVMRLVGHPEVIEEPWFKSGAARATHSALLDSMVANWIREHPLDEVMLAFERAEAAVAPIYDIEQIFNDPQFQALDAITEVPDPELGSVRMQNVMFRLSETPGAIRWAGRPLGEDNNTVYRDLLGLSPDHIRDLTARGVI